MKNLDTEVHELASEDVAMEVDVEDNKHNSDLKDKDCDEMNEAPNMNGVDEEVKNANGQEDDLDKSETEANNDLNGDVAPSSDFELELSETETESVKNSVDNTQEDNEGAVKENDCDVTQELDNNDYENKEDMDREESVETIGEQDRQETVETIEKQEKEASNDVEDEADKEEPQQPTVSEALIDGENVSTGVSTNDTTDPKLVEKKDEDTNKDGVSTDPADSSKDDSCKVLVSLWSTDSPKKGEDALKESNENEQEDKAVEAEKKEEEKNKEVKNTISLEMAEDDDDDGDNTSEEELDINAGLDKCFNDLEKRVEQEEKREESSCDQSTDISQDDKEAKSSDDNKETVAVDDSETPEKDKDDIVTLDPDEEDEDMEDSNNHDKALEEIENIEKTTKKILDESEVQSSKRPPSEDDSFEPAAKKSKVDQDEKVEEIDHKLKKVLKRMTRRDLEDMIQSKMVEILTNRSEIGELRQKVDSYQKTVEKWQNRAQALSKQCTDLGTVMKKYITDKKNKPAGSRVVPVKITRSVGLQVMTADQRQRQQQQQLKQSVTAGARIATKPQSVVAANRSVVSSSPVRKAPTSPVKILVNNNATNGVRQRLSVTKTSPATAAKLSPQQLAAVVRTAGQVTLTPKAAAAAPAKKTVIDVVDLSDEDEPIMPKQPVVQKRPIPRQLPAGAVVVRNGVGPTVHPAPLPASPANKHNPSWKISPSKPSLKINKRGTGIVLSWNLAHTVGTHATILSYQLYAYQETHGQRPDSSLWKKVGDVKALPLPMACTLTQFSQGNKYHFAVRALDVHNRLGPFSDPQNIKLT